MPKVARKAPKNPKKSSTNKTEIRCSQPKPLKEQVVVVEEVGETVEQTVQETPQETPQETLITPGDTKKPRQIPTAETVLESFSELIFIIEEEIQRFKDDPTKNKGSKFLRSVNKRVKILRGQTTRVFKQKQKNKIRRDNANCGFEKPVKISKELAKFCGYPEDELRSRVEVTKYICDYIANEDLQNPEDRRKIFPDIKLQKLLGYNPKKATEPLRYCGIQSHLKEKGHFIKEDKEEVKKDKKR